MYKCIVFALLLSIVTAAPNPKGDACVARVIVHRGLWASIATISVKDSIQGYPFSSVVSMSDGTIWKSTGNPYFYISEWDYPAQDTIADNRTSISVSLAQTPYCLDKKLDADDPRCGRVLITGQLEKLPEEDSEYTSAKNGLITRHPSLIEYPADHKFFVAKLDIKEIVLFGGPSGHPAVVDLNEYLAFNFPKNTPDISIKEVCNKMP